MNQKEVNEEGSLVVKLGGNAAAFDDAMLAFASELRGVHERAVVVHGGGKEVSALSERLGITPIFEDGVRMTGDQEMAVVEMVLAGTANKRLVRTFLAAGVQAIGIAGSDGGMVTGTPIADRDGRPSRTARVAAIDPRLIRTLWRDGYVPVVSPTSSTAEWTAVNINADDVAFALAGALRADALLFLSDVPGILVDGEPLGTITAEEAVRLIAAGVITGGMIPKVRNAVTAIDSGVRSVVIGNYRSAGDLSRLMDGSTGTTIRAQGGTA